MKTPSLKTNFQSFKKDISGNFATIFAVSIVPLFLSIGLAVDYTNVSRHKTYLQNSLDAASLAAAASDDSTVAEQIQIAQDVFAANIQNTDLASLGISPVFSIDGPAVNASLTYNYKLKFGALANRDYWPLQLSSKVNFSAASDAEVALVLDYSSSMNSSGKWQAMRDAGLALVDTLGEAGTNPNIKFGLVPFSKVVRVSMDEAYIVPSAKTGSGNWSITDGVWTGCTQDRKWPHNVSDETPNTGDADTMWGLTPTGSGYCDDMIDRDLTVLPLTNNHTAVNTQLNAMYPHSGTHISLGLEFGWHLISPDEPYTEGVDYNTPDVKKFIVLLTDGEQTTKAWGPSNSHSTSNGRDNIEDMCEDIKDEGVIILTVAFDLGDGSTKNRLKDCASNADYFFDAENNGDLSNAFDEVALIIQGATHLSQ